jgi:hypothetical protein
MKNVLFSMGLFAAVAMLSGCPKSTPKNVQFKFGSHFSLAPGQTIVSEDNDLSVTFDQVSGDSRCPKGVQCVWAGRADAVFTLSVEGAEEVVTLSSGSLSQGGMSQTTFKDYTVMLEAIGPEKTANNEIVQKDYRVTLKVEQQ